MNKRFITLVLLFIVFHISAQKSVFAPILNSPTPAAINQFPTVSLFWSSVPNAYIYKVQFDTIVPNNDLHSITVTNATNLDLTKLIFGKTYFWRVKSFGVDIYTNKVTDSSSWSPASSFTVINTVFLQKPVSGVISQKLPITLTWTGITGVTGYEYEVDINPLFNTIYFQSGNVNPAKPGLIPPTKVAISNLLTGTTYYWRIRTKHSLAVSGWSETRSFTTILNITDAPVLVYPPDSSVNIFPKFTAKWNPMQNTTGFFFQLADNNLFNNAFSDSIMLNKHGVRFDTSLVIDTLRFGQRYFWRVKGIDTNKTSPWSMVNTFTVISKPTGVTPVNSSVNQPTIDLSFTWKAINGATSYVCQADSSLTFDHPFARTINTNSTTFSGFKYSKVYHWRVKALHKKSTSDWSDAMSFTTYGGPMQKPELISPADMAVNQSVNPRFTWKGITSIRDTIHYKILADTAADFTKPISEINTTAASLISPDTFPNGKVIYWKVKAYLKVNSKFIDSSEYSSVYSFTTVNSFPQAPFLYTPTDSATDQLTNVKFSWSQTSGTNIAYSIQIDTSASFKKPIFSNTQTTLTLDAPSVLKFGKKYYWRVRTSKSNKFSPWSSVFSFTLINAPVLIAPADNSINQMTNVSLSWELTGGSSTSYTVEIDTSNSFTKPVSTYNITTNILNSPVFKFGKTYYWRVKATLNKVISNWSSIYSFTVYDAPILLSPADNSTDQMTNVNLSWSKTGDNNSYIFEMDTVDSFDNPILTKSQTVNNLNTSLLKFGKTYYWRVKASLNKDTSNWSSVYSFTVTNIPVLISPEDGAVNQMPNVNLAWYQTGGSSTTYYIVEIDTNINFIKPIIVNTNALNVNAPILKFGKEYYWRVKAVQKGDSSDWSSVYTLFVKDDITLISPIDDASNLPIAGLKFNWNKLTGITGYEIQADTTASFSSLALRDAIVADSMNIFNTLYFSKNYFWRVRAISTNDKSSWSAVRKFETIHKSKILYPLNNSFIEGSETNLIFTPLAGATDYDYKLDVNKNFNSSLLVNKSTYGLTNYKINNLQFGTTYFLTMRGKNSYTTSEWSDTISFTTFNKPILITPDDNAQNQMLFVNLGWENVPGSSQYYYQYSTNRKFILSNTVNVITLNNLVTTDTLKFNTRYYWNVQIMNSLNKSIKSDTLSFKTLNYVTLISPADSSLSRTAARAQTMSITFKWAWIKGVKNYQLQYSLNDTLHFTTETIAASSDSIIIEKLAKGQYFWRMRANTGSDTSAWTKLRILNIELDVNNINANNMYVDVYPVPCKDNLFIRFDNSEHSTYMNVTLINLPGQSIHEEKMDINQGTVLRSIDVSRLVNGIYYLKLWNGDFVTTRKIIIQK
jgi:hypothetical protein